MSGWIPFFKTFFFFFLNKTHRQDKLKPGAKNRTDVRGWQIFMPKKKSMHVRRHTRAELLLPLCSFACCSAGPIFSRSSAEMLSAGLIKAAPSCSHRIGMPRPLAAPPAGRLNHTRRRESQLRLGHQRPGLPSRRPALIIHLSFNYALISR